MILMKLKVSGKSVARGYQRPIKVPMLITEFWESIV